MTVYPLQANMTRGELTPYVHARADSEHYAAGLALARNVIVMRYGGITRVPGTIYQGPVKFALNATRFIRFEFNRSQVYAIEAGPLYFRFWTAAGRVESPPGTPVEVVTPYTSPDLKNMRVRQLGDVLYIWCRKAAGGAFQPRKLIRNSETSWSLELHNTENGPFLKEDTKGTTLTPASRGSLTPNMTSNVAPAGTVTNNVGGADAFEVFDNDEVTSMVVAGTNGYVGYQLAGGSAVVNRYHLKATNDDSQITRTPTSWVFEASTNGVTWVALDSRSNETGWVPGETRYYEFPNETPYEYHRFRWRTVQDADNSQFAELRINRAPVSQTPFNLVASSVVGINGNVGFLASDVGRVIRVMGSDGRWRTATIVTRTNATTVTITLNGHALPDLSPLARWQMGAFSEASGWPAAGAVYEDRLFHTATDADPVGLWGSVNADYAEHNVSTPVVADDAVSVRLTGGKLDDISWLVEMRDSLVAGTAGSLRAVGRNNDNEALGPSNFRQRAQTLAPASFAEPVVVENALLFLDLFEQRLYEAMYTYEVDGYLAREASTLNEHLFAAGVAEIVYLQHPHSIIVGRRYDGKLIFFTYDRANKVAGATLVDYGGLVESILDLPGETGTDLWMIVARHVDGNTERYVERMAEFWRQDYTVQELPVYAASALMYDGAATDGLSGLDHMEGETLGVWADGRDIGDAVVDGGEITLPHGVEAEQIVVGKRMTWHAQTLRLAQIGNQDGSGLGRRVTIVEGFLDVYESAGIFFGAPGVSDELRFEDQAEEDPDAPTQLRTGMHSGPVDDNWRNNGVLDIQGNKMYPVTVRAVQLNVDGEP